MSTAADAAKLADLRRAAGLTQKQLGERMGLGQVRISRIERSWPNLRLSTAQRYVAGCGGKLLIEITADGITAKSTDSSVADH